MLLAMALGCASDRSGSPPVSGAGGSGISALHLFGIPVALDLDGKPGVDGFAVTLYAAKRTQARGIEVTSGTVEVLMFDGILGASGNPAQVPSRTWTFSPKELKNHAGKYALGIGYRLALRWDPAVPAGDRITVIARYKSSDGKIISSSPSSISLSSR